MPNLLATFWMPDAETMRLVLPEMVLIGTIVAVLVAAMLLGRDTRVIGTVSLVGALATAVAAALTMPPVADGARELFGVIGPEGVGPGMLVADPLSIFFRLFVAVFLAAIIGMWFLFDAPRERAAPEFHTLLLSSALGMMFMTSTVNLLMMIIAIELASMPSYALAGFDRFRRIAAESSVKYVLFGATTSGFMIFGASLLYGMFGTLHIPLLIERIAALDFSANLYLLPLLAVSLLAVFAGIGFKISAVPFHFWCPDVFEGASLPVATWLSVASKAAGVVLLARIVYLFTGPDTLSYTEFVLPTLSYGIGFFAILTCTFANLAAYRQTNVRRLLAYSSIAHAGYMLAACAIVARTDDGPVAAISALLQYLVVYMFMNLGAFMAVGLVAADTGNEEMKSFTGLGWRDPLTAASLTVCLVSLIGLPPLGGFIAKWWLIYALGQAAEAGHSNLLWTLVIVIVLNTAVSLFYYARIIKEMYLRGSDHAGAALRAPVLGKAALHVCAVVLLLTGTLLVSRLKSVTDTAATFVYAGSAATVEVARQDP